MLETAASARVQAAFDAAHFERAEAFRRVFRLLRLAFRALGAAWPQSSARRWCSPPQACSADQ